MENAPTFIEPFVITRKTHLDLIRTWLTLREISVETNLWPLLVDESMTRRAPRERPQAPASKEQVKNWLEVQEQEVDMRTKTILSALERSSWAERTFKEYNQEELEEMLLYDSLVEEADAIMLVKAEKPWQAAVNAGLRTEKIPTSIHQGLHRRWHKRYGLQPVLLGQDSLLMLATRPPTTQKQLKAAIKENILYNPDYIKDIKDPEEIKFKGELFARDPLWFYWWG